MKMYCNRLEERLAVSQFYPYPILASPNLRHIHTDTVVASVI